MDIHLAKVSTYAEDVVDVFYVKDLEGQKITEEDHISEIRRALIHAIDATL
jgi:[protein-PII] uridylyltransferase